MNGALPRPPSPRRHGLPHRRALLALAAAILVVAASLAAARQVGPLLVAVDALGPSDAILVLDGATPARELAAADLWHQGLAPTILVSRARDPLDEATWRLAGLPRPQEASVRVLEYRGVPSTAIVRLGGVVENTRQELEVAHDYARAAGFRRLILVTSPAHTRRARLVWNRLARGASDGTPVAALLHATPYESFDARHWWRSRRSLETALHELFGILHFVVGSPLPTFAHGPGAPAPPATSWPAPPGTPPRASRGPAGGSTP